MKKLKLHNMDFFLKFGIGKRCNEIAWIYIKVVFFCYYQRGFVGLRVNNWRVCLKIIFCSTLLKFTFDPSSFTILDVVTNKFFVLKSLFYQTIMLILKSMNRNWYFIAYQCVIFRFYFFFPNVSFLRLQGVFQEQNI